MKVNVSDKLKKVDLSLVPGKNFVTGIDAFAKNFRTITSLEVDLLTLASAVYAVDLAIKREYAENYIRKIELDIELINKNIFDQAREAIEYALFILSDDNWTVNFFQKKGIPDSSSNYKSKDGKVLLFSGGLDSFCAAAELIKNNDEIVLVSHVTHNRVVEDSQINLKNELEKFYKKRIERTAFRIFPRSLGKYYYPEMQDREDSQRTRSFLFLILGALVARRRGFDKIIMIAENGQFAIHVPLTPARVGPFSTHTAHPAFINVMQDLLKKLLNLPNLNIINPYLYKTKSEVINTLDLSLRVSIPLSVSCWRSSRLKTQYHCGDCIPCLVRRIGLESLGISLNEYEKDIFRENIDLLSPDDIGKRNLIDLIEFIKRFSISNAETLLITFPELYNQCFDQSKAISMYKRFSAAALKVLNNYPRMKSLLR